MDAPVRVSGALTICVTLSQSATSSTCSALSRTGRVYLSHLTRIHVHVVVQRAHWHMTRRPAIAGNALLGASPARGHSVGLATRVGPGRDTPAARQRHWLLGYDRICQAVSDPSLSHSRESLSLPRESESLQREEG